jgi:beta-lactamase class D
MIEDRQSKNWAFTYLGADSNAWNAASDIGINMSNTVVWNTKNVGGTFRAASAMTSSYYTSCNVNNSDIYGSAGIADFNKLAEELK